MNNILGNYLKCSTCGARYSNSISHQCIEEQRKALREEYHGGVDFSQRMITNYEAWLESQLLQSREDCEKLKKKIKVLTCKHSFDVDGVCELCGLGYPTSEMMSASRGED